jgi:hypothetical protein
MVSIQSPQGSLGPIDSVDPQTGFSKKLYHGPAFERS